MPFIFYFPPWLPFLFCFVLEAVKFQFTCGWFFLLLLNIQCFHKLDGVGPVDNKPSTDKLHHFVTRKNTVTGSVKKVFFYFLNFLDWVFYLICFFYILFYIRWRTHEGRHIIDVAKTCPFISQDWRILQKWQFWLCLVSSLLLDLFYCLTYKFWTSNLCITVRNLLGFLHNFVNIRKNSKKLLKKITFKKYSFDSMFCDSRPNRGCVFIPSPVREGSTFLVITGVQFFRTELKSVRKVSADANLKRFQHKVL